MAVTNWVVSDIGFRRLPMDAYWPLFLDHRVVRTLGQLEFSRITLAIGNKWEGKSLEKGLAGHSCQQKVDLQFRSQAMDFRWSSELREHLDRPELPDFIDFSLQLGTGFQLAEEFLGMKWGINLVLPFLWW